jgi:GNAT superfamily N-acetyltransferase
MIPRETLCTRVAAAADAAGLVRLINSAYRGESSKAGWTTEADLLGGQRIDIEGLIEKLDAPGSVVLVHERGGAPVACVHLQREGDSCYIGLLTIQPASQAGGLGTGMLAAAEGWAAGQWGSRTMRMHVIAQRPELVAWYERRGYRRTGERKPFPYDDPRFGLPRRPDLIFEVLTKTLPRSA